MSGHVSWRAPTRVDSFLDAFENLPILGDISGQRDFLVDNLDALKSRPNFEIIFEGLKECHRL